MLSTRVPHLKPQRGLRRHRLAPTAVHGTPRWRRLQLSAAIARGGATCRSATGSQTHPTHPGEPHLPVWPASQPQPLSTMSPARFSWVPKVDL